MYRKSKINIGLKLTLVGTWKKTGLLQLLIIALFSKNFFKEEGKTLLKSPDFYKYACGKKKTKKKHQFDMWGNSANNYQTYNWRHFPPCTRHQSRLAELY